MTIIRARRREPEVIRGLINSFALGNFSRGTPARLISDEQVTSKGTTGKIRYDCLAKNCPDEGELPRFAESSEFIGPS